LRAAFLAFEERVFRVREEVPFLLRDQSALLVD